MLKKPARNTGIKQCFSFNIGAGNMLAVTGAAASCRKENYIQRRFFCRNLSKTWI